MEKINCNIANDLIPLYVDEILSEDSKELLTEHIKKCDKCKESIQKMKQDVPMMEDRDFNPFRKVQKKYVLRVFLVAVVMFLLYVGYIVCDLTVLPVFYVGDDLIADLQVVEMEEGLFLRRENLASRGEVVIVEDNDNGEVKLYLGENIFGRFRMGWTEPLTYTQIAPSEPSFGEETITKVSYCDKDGNVLYVLWEKE